MPPAPAGADLNTSQGISVLAIFAVLQSDHVAQVGDKTRLDASSSFASPVAAITKVEIKPATDAEFIEVSPEQPWLDWIYTEAGLFTPSLRVTTGEGEAAVTGLGMTEITVLTEEDDRLFSSDSDLKGVVPLIYRYLPDGRASFKYAHRASQEIILDRINRRMKSGAWLSAEAVANIEQVRQWSKYLTLASIYAAAQIAKDDFFFQEQARFANAASKYESATYVELKLDGSQTANAEVSFGSVPVRRS